MTVEEGADFFKAVPSIRDKLETLARVGLGYIHIGQQATTLSGGEAQRIKLSKELSRRATGRTLYILDEPTTGLHFHDVAQAARGAARAGRTPATPSSSSSTISKSSRPPTGSSTSAPKAATAAAPIVADGTPEDVAKVKESYTGQYLKPVLARKPKPASKKQAAE